MSEPDQIFAGKYRLIAELGRGGMAEVNLAVASGPAGFNKLVVIKQLRQSLADDPEFLNMFLDEARLAARLNHPNVVHTYEVVAEGGHHFIAMEYLDGQPLSRVVREFSKSGGLPLGVHLRMIADSLAGIHYAHELCDYDGTPLNVVHRDISPHNIFVTYEGQTKVVDFGIAKALNSSSETRSGVIKGKISYMSPEQSRSEALDRRSDLFAVGIMLWEAVTGLRLWKGLADVTILQRLMVNQPLPSPRDAKPEVSEALEAICMKALAPLREDRYATALDMQNDIENVMMDMRLRVNGRDISKVLNEKFAAERAEIKAVIESQLRTQPGENSRIAKISPMSQSQSLPALSIAPSSQTPVSQNTATFGSSQPGPSALSVPPPSMGPIDPGLAPVSIKPPARTAGPLRAGAALVGVCLVAALSWVVVSSKKPPVDATKTAAASEPAQVSKIALNLRASPNDARMFLDDERLPSNPYAGFRARDGSKHALRIEADGYAPKSRSLVFDADVSLDLELEKTADPAKADAPKPADKPDPPTATGRRRGGGKAPDKPADPKPAETKAADPPPLATGTKKPGANVTLDPENPWLKPAPRP